MVGRLPPDPQHAHGAPPVIWWVVALGVIGLWHVGTGVLMVAWAVLEIFLDLFRRNPWEED